MSKAWAAGSSTRWRKLRARILADNTRTNQGLCQLRLRGCTGQANVVHHIYGRAITGDDPAHLQAVCRHCNLKAGDPTTNHPMPRRVTRW
jgi:5-methylcytosine-specific restriction endonuclease McrA